MHREQAGFASSHLNKNGQVPLLVLLGCFDMPFSSVSGSFRMPGWTGHPASSHLVVLVAMQDQGTNVDQDSLGASALDIHISGKEA